jgi:1,2-diacylglycerol 3-alpha-glucosyltransferase
LLVREKPDIIFIHNCQFIDIYKVVKYTKRHLSTRIYVDNHADYVNSGSSWVSRNILHKIIWRKCAQLILPYTSKFYGVLPVRCDFLNNVYKIPKCKIELLVMGVDDESIQFDKRQTIREKIRSELNISNDDFVLVTGGKIDKRKNIHLLMEAMKSFSGKNIKLIVFGDVIPSMKDEFMLLSDNPDIISIGWLPSAKVPEYLIASDLAVFPGTHSVLWEQSVGCGIPSIFKHWDGMTHLDLGGNCIFLYNDSIDEIKKSILNIINDKQLYSQMKKSSLEKGLKAFSYSEIARRSIEF